MSTLTLTILVLAWTGIAGTAALSIAILRRERRDRARAVAELARHREAFERLTATMR